MHPGSYSYPRPVRPGNPPATWPPSPRSGSQGAGPLPLTRVVAALCYSIPIVPSLVVLLRERRDRFARFHAAQALLLHALIFAGQLLIYLLLMVAGGIIHDLDLAVIAAVAIVALFAALGLGALWLWFRVVADCLDGRLRPLPLIGGWARRIAFSRR